MFAAESATASSKRARQLFGFQPVPDVEDIGYAAQQQRRRRLVLGDSGCSEGTTTTTATGGATMMVLPKSASSATGPKSVPLALMLPYSSTSSTGSTGTSTPTTTTTTAAVALALKPAAPVVPTPTWHAPWKLSTVLASHLGWVRCIAFDPDNRFMATGAADRVIKIWNFPKASAGTEDALQLTLTGHISAVRGLAFSDRHPYLFSAAEDKTVKCWDLETNQVVRHYHGHLSGVYALKLHPTLDVLVTAGRDAVARVWDMRTKHQIHVLSGHEHTVTSLLTASVHPQIITGSHDSTVKLWDLAAGKCLTTLTHHGKSIRALADAAGRERSFVSASADGTIRKWQGKNGKFLTSIRHDDNNNKDNARKSTSTIWNAVAVQEDGVMVSGSDDGALDFWDYDTGYCFQRGTALVQPGSLEQAENAILCTQFDRTGTRLVTGHADKTLQIWKADDEASELTHPIDMKRWRKTCLARAQEWY